MLTHPRIFHPPTPAATAVAFVDALLAATDIVDYRNPILAEAMRVLGLAQRYGAGIPMARRALRVNDNRNPISASSRTGCTAR